MKINIPLLKSLNTLNIYQVNNFKIPSLNIKSTIFVISKRGPTLWNAFLSNTIKTTTNLSAFQSVTKQLIFSTFRGTNFRDFCKT